jgi:hypothetical protein
MNLLSQENSAKEDRTKKVVHKSKTINLDDIEEIKMESDKTPTQHIDFNMQLNNHTDKMEERMLQNMWEIENHPIFSSGGSLTDSGRVHEFYSGKMKEGEL